MATIRKRGDKWQARVQRRGVAEQSRSFLNRVDAEKWSGSIAAEIDRRIFASIKEAERTTLADILLRFQVQARLIEIFQAMHAETAPAPATSNRAHTMLALPRPSLPLQTLRPIVAQEVRQAVRDTR